MHQDRFWELMARKMAGEASERELHELEDLLCNNPHFQISAQTFKELWHHPIDISDLTGESDLAFERHLNRMNQAGLSLHPSENTEHQETVMLEDTQSTKIQYIKYIAAASVVIIMSIIGWTYYSWNHSQQVLANQLKETKSEVSTKNGSKTKIQLPDGTQVWLNAGSKLNYKNDFGKEFREVTLTGEAFFDVVKNAQKPFIIHTATIDVRVLGTKFNVKSYPGDKTTETSLVRGSVEVVVRKRPNEKYILKPNEKIVVLNEENLPRISNVGLHRNVNIDPIIAIKKLTFLQGDTVALETAWAYNKLSFEDEPFVEVARKMQRWYNVNFEFRNDVLKEIRLNGTFVNETLPQAMEALKYTNRFRYEIQGDTIIIY